MIILFYILLFIAIGGTPRVLGAIFCPNKSLPGMHGVIWALAIVLAICVAAHRGIA